MIRGRPMRRTHNMAERKSDSELTPVTCSEMCRSRNPVPGIVDRHKGPLTSILTKILKENARLRIQLLQRCSG